MADPITDPTGIGDRQLRFSDLALFSLSGRYALFSKLELSGQVSFLAKQPSDTDEKPWQSVSLGLRSPLAKRVALAIQGGGGHLIDHAGMWTQESMTVQWRHPINDVVTFDLSGGLDGIGITAPRSTSAFVTELAGGGSALFREPSGHWGAWVGLGYAVPVDARGTDPTTGMDVDPQPRLDLRVGTVLSIKRWDLFVEYAVVDRGDRDPATRLPVLDGGFDQRQVVLGVVRHLDLSRPKHHDDPMMAL